MNYTQDPRIVLTLDAGGTNFVFSAMANGQEIVSPLSVPAVTDDAARCQRTLAEGFRSIWEILPYTPSAVSFAFPGPADYAHGIIGDLPNFPGFRGGVALGPYLEHVFGIPVFINNDGNLFAYGEALTGILPEVNDRLKACGSQRRYHNLIGVTLGTGFGAGVVIRNELLTGDNSTGGDMWCQRNHKYPEYIVEESVSIRAVRHVYARESGSAENLSPKDIFQIAEGTRNGNPEAARAAFAELGQMAAEALASALTLIDGLVVIGGGLSGAYKYIRPALFEGLRGTLGMRDGSRFPRLQMEIYDLEDEKEFEAFATTPKRLIPVLDTDRTIPYDAFKRTGIALTRQGTNRSIALGAYTFALRQLDRP